MKVKPLDLTKDILERNVRRGACLDHKIALRSGHQKMSMEWNCVVICSGGGYGENPAYLQDGRVQR